MVSDGVIFRFQADIKDLNAKIDMMSKKFDQLGIKSRGAQTNVAGVGNAADRAGQQAISSSVKFQTATQGMLNLTTATVQTITSLSNLDRVQNRAKLAAIAVARAEDLLANKQERLNMLRESGSASAQKLANMEKEIITATEDLTVKQEKLKIEQGAINDIYALFFTNIANVGISSFQTLVSVMQLMTVKTIANTTATEGNFISRTKATLATKFHSAATWNNTHSLIPNTAQQIVHNKAIGVSVVVTRQLTIAQRALTFAMGPIGLALIGITAALGAYEAATGGISKAMGFAQEDALNFEKSLNEQRNAVDANSNSFGGMADSIGKVNNQMSESIKLIGKMQNAFLEQHSAAAQNTNQLIALANAQTNLFRSFGGGFR